jgi:hypothetical protein
MNEDAIVQKEIMIMKFIRFMTIITLNEENRKEGSGQQHSIGKLRKTVCTSDLLRNGKIQTKWLQSSKITR